MGSKKIILMAKSGYIFVIYFEGKKLILENKYRKISTNHPDGILKSMAADILSGEISLIGEL